MTKTNIVDWETITNFVTDAFVGYGIPREDAEICTDVLLESDKRGIESHGVNRFKPIYLDRIKDGIQKPVTNLKSSKRHRRQQLLTVMTVWDRLLVISPCVWLSTKQKNTAWVWLLSAIPAITVLPDTTEQWLQRKAASESQVQMHVRL